ncbi:MAG: AI-2E family transporter [Thalassobaculum sp.]|uniref:AI-2E family transporter n=1 Tax=Thalassobaculum sp. TaxID=2022740 RepID=UPI0032F04DB7
MPDAGTVPPPEAVSRLPSIDYAVWVLAACVFGAAMFAASAVVIPIVGAAVLSVIVAPIARWLMRRLHLPNGLASLAAFLLAVVVILSVALIAVPTVQRIANDFPLLSYRVEYKLRSLALPIDAVKSWSETVEKVASFGQETDNEKVVVREGGGTIGQLMSSAPGFAAQLLLMVVLVFFFVRDRRTINRTVLALAPTHQARLRIGRVSRLVQRNAVSYLAAVTMINVTLGVATGTAFWIIGMPEPWAWGAAMAVLNYLPFIGPFTLQVISFLAGLIVFPSVEAALVPPIVLLALNIAESNFGMPLVMERRFMTSPLAILIGIAFGAWLWGVAGAILAVPLVVMVATGMRAFYDRGSGAPVTARKRVAAVRG